MTKLLELKDGEILVGLTLHEGKPHHLILLAGDDSMPWKEAVAWAKKQGGDLPSRIDMLVLFKHLRGEFKRDWYWTSEEGAGSADYAWLQRFFSGSQSSGRKSYDFRCRAVRRVAI